MIQGAATGRALPAFIGHGDNAPNLNGAARPGMVRPSAEKAEMSAQKLPVVDQQALEQAVARVREEFEHVEPRLKIEIDPDLHRVIVKVMDGQSGEIVRQIPPEELLKIARQLSEAKGVLITQYT